MELLLAVTSCQGFLQIGCCSYERVEEKKKTNIILKRIILCLRMLKTQFEKQNVTA